MKKQPQLIDKDTLIGEILSLIPESAEVMMDYGLHCLDCSVNAFEPIGLGALSHGISEDDVARLIQKINDIFIAKQAHIKKDQINITESAIKEILRSAKEDKEEGHGLKVIAKNNGGKEPKYGMEFKVKPSRGDQILQVNGITLFVDKESFKNLQGAEIDFIDSPYGSGFKIWSPSYNSDCACKTGDSCSCEE
ncbi:MAG: iron-sulfur cluster assembly accessory protein [Candidatus Gracilibacteria bacterium]